MPDVTAVFAASDEMAFGVIRAVRDHGRFVPHDVSVIGVDDIPLAAYGFPVLTTIAQPFTDVGRLAVQHLLETIATPNPGRDALPAPSLVLEPQLVVRDSITPPRA